MSREKLIIAGAVLLGLLGVLVYRQAKKDESIGAPTTAAATEYPTISAPDDIDKISITNGDKGEVVLEKVVDPNAAGAAGADGGPPMHWVLTGPVHAEANQQTIKDLVANLKDLTVASRIDLRLDDEVRKEKQLDPAHAIHVVAWRTGSKKVDESFGKSGPAGQLVMVADKPDAVWAAKGFSSYLYTKEAKDFRDKEVFHLDEGSVSAVEIVNSHGKFAFTKGDKWTATFDKKPIPRFDPEKAKDMVRIFKSVNAIDFGEGKSLADTGLEKPEAHLTMHLKGDDKNYELFIGKISSGTDRYAKRVDREQIYVLSNYTADYLTSDVSKYQSSADAGAPAATARPKGDAGKK
ncbi:MAG TPA: DUF4340 domain-containing protein [Polyangiaceae bacterium]|nr:DUF4340 domain-containing protein [Polyangiaceae bacterium]